MPQIRSITVTNPKRPYQLSVFFAIVSAGVFLIELLGGGFLGVGAPAFHGRGAQLAELLGKELLDLVGGGVSVFSRVENGFELSGQFWMTLQALQQTLVLGCGGRTWMVWMNLPSPQESHFHQISARKVHLFSLFPPPPFNRTQFKWRCLGRPPSFILK
ncbi:MAG: hypothetical protein ACKVJX_19370 [Verrucomicrobiia bacterium]